MLSTDCSRSTFCFVGFATGKERRPRSATGGTERIVFTTQFGFAHVPRPGGDLGEQLYQANLFGLD